MQFAKNVAVNMDGETRNVDVRLPGEGKSNSHVARPVHQIIKMIKWIRTSECQKGTLLSSTCPQGGSVRGGADTHRGTSLIRNNPPVGPFTRPMSRALWWC